MIIIEDNSSNLDYVTNLYYFKKKVAIIGAFGYEGHVSGGQVTKTLNLYKALDEYTNWEIKTIDTSTLHMKPLHLIFSIILCLCTTRDVIITVARNGRRFLFPILYIFSKINKCNIYHDIIGGQMAGDVQHHPRYRKYLNEFVINWVETKLLKEELEQYGIENVEILPNFRCMNPLSQSDLVCEFTEPFPFCTFSVIRKEKGIDDAIGAVRLVNEKYGKAICSLDIYGPIQPDYEDEFRGMMQHVGSYIHYCGIVPTDYAVQTLKKYYATLFPTRWIGESNAGTITESFFAGVPVLATDWRCNGEMITDGYNGILYPGVNAKTLAEAITWSIAQRDRIREIKLNCLHSAEKYSARANIVKVINIINE